MNIIILSFLNLDLLDLDKFTQQFITNGHELVNMYLIDHLASNDTKLSISNPILSLKRIAINNIITYTNPEPDKQFTTYNLYKDYLVYLSRVNSPNRKLIENIFYLRPDLIQFVQLYLFSIIELSKILSAKDQSSSISIISCDPIFHHLINELRPYQPSAVDFFYTYVSEKLNMQVWQMPVGMPVGIPVGIPTTIMKKCTSRLAITFKSQELYVESPEVITKLGTNDITNLDMLLDANQLPDNKMFIGKINNVTNLGDIQEGLNQIFQYIITNNIRVPRHHISHSIQSLQILILPPLLPTPQNICVLADISRQLTPEFIPHHHELINREMKLLQPELDMLALEWELKIQRFVKIPIQIKIK